MAADPVSQLADDIVAAMIEIYGPEHLDEGFRALAESPSIRHIPPQYLAGEMYTANPYYYQVDGRPGEVQVDAKEAS